MKAGHYIGHELEVFAGAVTWKTYYAAEIRGYLAGDVLEVGAGLGANTQFLKSRQARSWTCLEPDPDLADRMRRRFAADPNLADCQVETATTEDFVGAARFDSIAYIDVLEHILDDRAELERAAGLLRKGGIIVVLAPAHQWLYAPFDRAIGHYRRYDAARLHSCTPIGCSIARTAYLDCAGMLASAVNRVLLKEEAPGLRQILFWDRVLVPLSKVLDRLTFHLLGKTILAVWTKN
jgi:SAM-dependent methyltransferase